MGPSELATARAAQARTLTATCSIGRVVRGPLDEDTGQHPEVIDPVWSGPCAVKTGTSTEVDTAGRLVIVSGVTVSIPVEGTEAVEPGMVIEVTDALHDAALVGLRVTLKGPAEGTSLTLRRFPAKEYP